MTLTSSRIYFPAKVKDSKTDGHAATATIEITYASGAFEYDRAADRTGAADSVYGTFGFSAIREEIKRVRVVECVEDVDCGSWTQIYPR
ncbi:hypothetical protein ACWC0A_22320 [Streptomyces scopuliridis]|uniref:hypothetical protein n=1 Tax=Streptomyces scopuliridis TaxID=452529 RepID=UPI003676843E